MTDTAKTALVIIRRKQVEARTGLPRSSIYAGVANGTFPKPIALGEKSVGWLEHEVEEWIASRVAVSRDRTNSATPSSMQRVAA